MAQMNQNETVSSSKTNQEITQNSECQLNSTVQQRIGNTNIISNENLEDGQSDLHSSVQMSHDASQYGPVILQLLTELKQRYTPPNQSQIKSDEASTSNIPDEGDLLNKIFEPNCNILDYCNTDAINSELQNRNDVHVTEQQSCSNARKRNLKSIILPTPTVIRKRSFSCQICEKVFTLKCNLKTHMFIHSGEKSFSCSVCNKRFTQKANLNRHMFIHSGEKPFLCSVCGKRFTRNDYLNKHLLTHSDEKPFLCTVCGKRFTRNEYLNRHLLTHSDEKPFVCTYCNKRFCLKSAHNRHILTHSRVKLFSCNICNNPFARKDSLARHMLLTHTG